MKVYHANDIRNIAAIGHGGKGKTTLIESMLFCAGHLDRMGKVEDGNTASDFDAEEIKRQFTISATLAPVEWKEHKINMIDTPGYFDFEGEVIESLSVVDSALIVMSGVSGLTVGGEIAWSLCKKRNLPRAIVVNRMDVENVNFNKVMNGLVGAYGTAIVPLHFPIMKDDRMVGYVDVAEKTAWAFDGAQSKSISIPEELLNVIDNYHEQLIEAAAETDEELLEKYLGGEELSKDELHKGVRVAIESCSMVPVFCTIAATQEGVRNLMDALINYMPAPSDAPARKGLDASDQEIERSCDEKQPFSAQVFKTIVDPFVGRISMFRVYSGVINSGENVYNSCAEKSEKTSNLMTIRGKKNEALAQVCAGDIGAVAKLQNTVTGDTLCDLGKSIRYPKFEFPKAVFSKAVLADKSGEEDKVFAGLFKLQDEDPTFTLEKNPETGDMVLSGMGEMHLDVLCAKLKNKFNVQAKLVEPLVAYREAIRKNAKAQGRHKKQSGGSGQFGDVWIEFEPILDGSSEFEFVDRVVGGAVPRNFIPAVEKGLREAIDRGPLAGYPLINIRCILYDGSSHPVDSNEMAFKMAARLAFRKACEDAAPILLEPIYRYEIRVPEDFTGDIMGDLNRRRGRIMGMDPSDEGQLIIAEVPMAEMFSYATDLRSMTQGRGKFEMFFDRYEDVPANLIPKIIEKSKNKMDDAE